MKGVGAGRRSVAVVTGAGRGIGKAIASALASFGHRRYIVVLAERDKALGAEAAQEIRTKFRLQPEDVVFVPTDVSKPSSVSSLFRTIESKIIHPAKKGKQSAKKSEENVVEEEERTLDVVVNNAGVLNISPLVELPVEDLGAMLDVNLKGSMMVTQQALRMMLPPASKGTRKRGRDEDAVDEASEENPTPDSGPGFPKYIVNIASGLGKDVAAEYIPYSSSKHGMVAMTKGLALELRQIYAPRFPRAVLASHREPIKVVAVCPGLVNTEMAVITRFPELEKLEPEDVAELVRQIVVGEFAVKSGELIDINA